MPIVEGNSAKVLSKDSGAIADMDKIADVSPNVKIGDAVKSNTPD